MTASRPAPQQLVDGCQGLVRSLALSIHRKLPPHVELEDLIAYGQIGLVEAARDFDPNRGGQFSTYAYYRIRGAIYDGLSKMSWFGRAEQKRVRYERLGNDVLRLEGEKAEASQADDSAADVRWFRNVTRALAMVYLVAHTEGEEGPSQEALVDHSASVASATVISREVNEKLHRLIEALPAEAAALIRATYFEGLTLQEAGARLGVSKSWASRLHARTLQRLARSLRLEGVTV